MPEPIDPILRCPMGGWPKAAVRVELVGVTTLDDAIYQLAGLARVNRMGFVATWEARDLYAYPHQSTAEIARSYAKLKAMEAAHLGTMPEPEVQRWTAVRKVGLVVAIAEGFIARLDALARYRLSTEELEEWEQRYARFGRQGLKAGKAQMLRLSPPAAENAA